MLSPFIKRHLKSDSPDWREGLIVLLNYFMQLRRSGSLFPKRLLMGGLNGCLRDFWLYWMQMEAIQNGKIVKIFYCISSTIYSVIELL